MSSSRATRRWTAIIAAGAAVIGVSAAAGYWLGQSRGSGTGPGTGQADAAVLYWYDPMVPDQHFDKPGKSPFMDMELVPRYANEAPDTTSVRIEPGVAQNLGLRLAVVERKLVQARVFAAGTLTFNARDVTVIEARASGFVEQARPLAIGDIVRAGDVLADLRIPAWTGAIAEYLALQRSDDSTLVAASRQRLLMLGVPEADIKRAEQAGVAPSTFAIRASIGGAVTALGVRDGMTINQGAPIASINALSPVWLVASVPQAIAGQLKPGAGVAATLPAFPGETLRGTIESILPQASMASRTIEVRIALPNPGGRLRPGMTAEVDLSGGEAREVLVAPAEAVIRTGRRSVVIVASNEVGRFMPVEVELGGAFGDDVEIVSGLDAGQRVVASGQFLIDSEASLTGVLARLRSASGPPASSGGSFTSVGRVTGADATGVTLAHEPVPELNWPGMTMRFGWGAAGPVAGIEPGDEVDFRFREGGAGYELETITPRGELQ